MPVRIEALLSKGPTNNASKYTNSNHNLGVKRWCFIAASLVLLFGATLCAQTTEFLPEINTYVKLDPNVRFTFQAKQTRENGDPTQGEIGPSIDFHFRPFRNLGHEHPNQAKTRYLLLSFGYRYVPTRDRPPTNRILLVATPRLPLKAKVVASDRNRGELNFSNGDLTWRYRNRLQLEREVTIRSYRPTPFANVEVYYDSRFQKWSSTAIEAGCQFLIRKHSEIEFYYEHQNNTGTAPNRQVDGIGLMLNLYFQCFKHLKPSAVGRIWFSQTKASTALWRNQRPTRSLEEPREGGMTLLLGSTTA